MTNLSFNKHTYEIITTAKTWDAASKYAQSVGAHLATISSAEENAAIYNYALKIVSITSAPKAGDGGGAVYLWLGASDIAKEGEWRWIDGTSVSDFTKWGSGIYGTEPDNYLGLQNALGLGLQQWPQPSGGIGNAGQWNDVWENNSLYFVMEWDSLKESDQNLASSNVSTKTTDGNDSITATSGHDTLDGGLGKDTLIGGSGDDLYIIDNVNDKIIELSFSGIDTVLSKISYSLGSNLENLGLLGATNINATGNVLSNALSGNDGKNTLNGMAGDDALSGGKGSDKLTGGKGADIFKFSSIDETGITLTTRDTITDFKHSESDKIHLLAIDANMNLAGDQAFKFIGNASFSKNATAELRFDSKTHILYGSVNADSTPEFSILLSGVSNVVASDVVF